MSKDDPKNTVNHKCPKFVQVAREGGICVIDKEPCWNVYDCHKMRSKSIIERS